MKHRFTAIILALCIITLLLPQPAANAATAKDISSGTTISGSGFEKFSFLTDKDIFITKQSDANASIRLRNHQGIGSLYLIFNWEPGQYTVKNNADSSTVTVGQKNYLHEFIDITALFGSTLTDITISFEDPVDLTEIYIFGQGQTPAFVEKWDDPHEGNADIVLFSSHGDDEQLFYAGLLPYYGAERQLNVQVVYMTDHRNQTTNRVHEMLNGLWAVGIRAYPVLGEFPDFLIEDMERTYQGYKSLGYSRDELLGFVVEQIRRFKPVVAVGHDIAGEYSHGMHMVYTDCLIKALPITADATQFPESAEKYGVWDIPKTYLHLYEENPIVINYDIPLSAFNGLTAFQVTQKLGFPCHYSQQKTRFHRWLNGEEGAPVLYASQITELSPCEFGLYRSTVGPDVLKNDFMENVHSHSQYEQMEQDRIEQERLEQERLEQERLEQERLEKEQALQLQEDQAKAQQQKNRRATALWISVICLVIVAAGIAHHNISALQRRRKRNSRRRKSVSGKSNK